MIDEAEIVRFEPGKQTEIRATIAEVIYPVSVLEKALRRASAPMKPDVLATSARTASRGRSGQFCVLPPTCLKAPSGVSRNS